MTLDTRQIASAWLDSCSAAFTSDDVAGITHLFLQDGWLRDFLVFTWDLRSLAGREKIATYLTGILGKSQITDVCLNETSDLAPRIFPFGPDKTSGVDFAFSFNCTHGIGRAHVRVVPDTDGVYRAYTLLMELQDLVGHEERSTLLTRDDVTHVAGRNMQQEYEEMVRDIETKPHALISKFHSATILKTSDWFRSWRWSDWPSSRRPLQADEYTSVGDRANGSHW